MYGYHYVEFILQASEIPLIFMMQFSRNLRHCRSFYLIFVDSGFVVDCGTVLPPAKNNKNMSCTSIRKHHLTSYREFL